MKKNKIVTILAASALLTLSLAATSFAAVGDKEVDLSIGFATESHSGSDFGFATSVGGGYELLKVPAIKGSTLQVRGDIGYNRWSQSVLGTDLKFTRVPVSAGARLYVPIEAVQNFRVYGEASLEVSFDESDTPYVNNVVGPIIDSRSDVNVGLTPGVGVEYVVAPNIFVGGGLKLHVIKDVYLTALAGVGFKF